MIKLRHIFSTLCASASMLLLSACQNAAVLDPKGVIGIAEKKLLIDAVLLMLIVVVPVIILTAVLAYKYRASNKKAKYSPNWAHATFLEAGWWIIPIVIISVLATITWRTSHELDPYKPLDSKVAPVNIQVVALNWRWLFIYPDQHIATINEVAFPVNTPVNFLITSDAPMNSFVIQQLAGQIYAMAGMQTKLHLMANEVGDYNGRSVSFSGEGFANMTFIAHATTNQGFSDWVNKVKKSPNSLTLDAYNKLVPDSKDTKVYYFSNVQDNLFNDIIMKYMGPDMSSMANTETKAKVENMTQMNNSQGLHYHHHKPNN